MKYLDILAEKIWKSDILDNAIYEKLCCEMVRINTLLVDCSIYYNETKEHSDKLEETYSYGGAYKKRIMELLTIIECNLKEWK